MTMQARHRGLAAPGHGLCSAGLSRWLWLHTVPQAIAVAVALGGVPCPCLSHARWVVLLRCGAVARALPHARSMATTSQEP